MRQHGGGKAGSPARTLIRPLLMLVLGLVAGVVMWRLLMAEPSIALR